MHWFNFSEVEARYVVAFMDRLVGRKFFSAKRLLVTLLLSLTIIAIPVIHGAISGGRNCLEDLRYFEILSIQRSAIAVGTIASIAFAASLSLSRWLSLAVIWASRWRFLGPLPYMILLALHLLLLKFWMPISGVLIGTTALALTGPSWKAAVSDGLSAIDWKPIDVAIALNTSWTILVGTVCNSFPNLFSIVGVVLAVAAGLWRLVVALTLLVAFILREWLSHFVSTVWARIYEDNDGAFTLIFAGFGAVAGGIKALMS